MYFTSTKYYTDITQPGRMDHVVCVDVSSSSSSSFTINLKANQEAVRLRAAPHGSGGEHYLMITGQR